MRVLHMIPDIGVANGVMSVILNYFKAMPLDIKFDVCYFAEKKETRQADIEKLGGRVFKIPAPSPKGLLRRDMSRFFADHKGEWQALHIHAPHFAVFMVPQAKAAGIKRICCHCHSTWYSLEKANEKRNKLLAAPAKKLTDVQFACGEAAGRFWFKKDFCVIRNAVDCAAFRFDTQTRNAVRDALGIGGKFAVGNLGRVYPPQKNHPFIIETFAEIKKMRKDSVLLLVGAEKDEMLEERIKTYSLPEESVRFLGNRKDVSDLLSAMDVFLFPSLKEGLPVSVVEAQASGLPVLMSDRVTKEVTVTQDVFSLPLEAGARAWAEKVMEIGVLPRKDTYGTMKDSGWDIFDCAEKLAGYYRTGVYEN